MIQTWWSKHFAYLATGISLGKPSQWEANLRCLYVQILKSVCVCVRSNVHRFMKGWVCRCVWDKRHRIISGVLRRHFPRCFLETVVVTGLGLSNQARLAAPGICISPPPHAAIISLAFSHEFQAFPQTQRLLVKSQTHLLEFLNCQDGRGG